MDGYAKSSDRVVLGATTPPVESDLCWVEGDERACAHFELRAGEESIASLRFCDPAGLAAVGESKAGAWILVDEGLLRPRIIVRSLPDDTAVAVYRPRPLGHTGTLAFLDGREFHWRRLGFLATSYRFEGTDGSPVVAIGLESRRSWLFGPREFRGLVAIEPRTTSIGELLPLLLLSWYLVVLQQANERFQSLP
jgi:hypothetical protein